MQPTLLLTWTPTAPVAPRVLRARIFRTDANKWSVLVRDIAYDGAPKPRYVSQRDFEMLTDAETFARLETGHDAPVTFAREVNFSQNEMRAPRSY